VTGDYAGAGRIGLDLRLGLGSGGGFEGVGWLV
jgi:hypothetical protein